MNLTITAKKNGNDPGATSVVMIQCGELNYFSMINFIV